MEQKIIGKNIARIRKDRGLTQAQLAEFLFVTPQTVSKWEMENGTPDISLLPKIAMFLDVTIDDLFGISNFEHVEDLVLRYSVLRQDNLYYEAMRTLENQLSIISKEGSKQEYYKLQGLKTHLLLQNSRERLKEGKEILRQILSEIGQDYEQEWYLPFVLQLTLFEKMDGEIRNVCENNREVFEQMPNEITLRVICETYMMLEQYEQVVALLTENDKAKKLLEEVHPKNKPIHIAKLSALAKLGNRTSAEVLAQKLLEESSFSEKFEIKTILMNMYMDEKDKDAFERIRGELVNDVDELQEKDYIKELYRTQLKEMKCESFK